MIVENTGERNCIIIDNAVPVDSRVSHKKKKENGEISRFEKGNQKDLKYEKCDSCTCDCGCTPKHHKEIQ